jgi:CDP-diacylglycerol--serine O-phosphatidyltransferase
MKSIIKQIPNVFTLGNLSCGVLSILKAFEQDWQLAAYLIFLAAFLDFFDGFFARLLHVSGELGKQLDSLADCVTFGVAPSILLWQYAHSSQLGDSNSVLNYSFLLLAVFSAYRLAKFNIDKRQTDSFIGVPTPITGMMVASFAFIKDDFPLSFDFLFSNSWVYFSFCLIISLLLISEIPLVSLKIKKGKPLKFYIPQMVIALIGLISLLFFQWLALPIIYVVYVLSSIFVNFAKK